MSEISNFEFVSTLNNQLQRLVDGAESHNPQTFNEESQRLLNLFFSRNIETELTPLHFLVPRREAPHWNPSRVVAQEASYNITAEKAPLFLGRAAIEDPQLRPLVNMTMHPAKYNNMIAYWYNWDNGANAVVLPDSRPPRIVTHTLLV
jgi:hypothetical protein